MKHKDMSKINNSNSSNSDKSGYNFFKFSCHLNHSKSFTESDTEQDNLHIPFLKLEPFNKENIADNLNIFSPKTPIQKRVKRVCPPAPNGYLIKRQKIEQNINMETKPGYDYCIPAEQSLMSLKRHYDGKKSLFQNVSKKKTKFIDTILNSRKTLDINSHNTPFLEQFLTLDSVYGLPYTFKNYLRHREMNLNYSSKYNEEYVCKTYADFTHNISINSDQNSDKGEPIRLSLEDSALFQKKTPKQKYHSPIRTSRVKHMFNINNDNLKPTSLTLKPIFTNCFHFSPEEKKTYIDQVYTVGDLIGSGSFSDVFRAKNRHTGVVSAIKRCKNLYNNQQNRNEIENILDIGNHLNIVGLLGAWEQRHRYYLEFEYCHSSCMFLLTLNGAFDKEEIWNVSCDILSAIQFIHSKRYVHLDIKPHNILKSNIGIYKLCDFGLSQNIDKNLNDEVSEGDTKYLAPEILKCIVTFAADIYSFGITIFELASNTSIPPSGTRWVKIINKKSFPMFAIKNHNSELSKLIYDCLNPNYKDRPSIYQIINQEFIRSKINQRMKENLVKDLRFKEKYLPSICFTNLCIEYMSKFYIAKDVLPLIRNKNIFHCSYDITPISPLNSSCKSYSDFNFGNDIPFKTKNVSNIIFNLNEAIEKSNLNDSYSSFGSFKESVMENKKVSTPKSESSEDSYVGRVLFPLREGEKPTSTRDLMFDENADPDIINRFRHSTVPKKSVKYIGSVYDFIQKRPFVLTDDEISD
ncbi:Myt1 kinase [Intoshia linei]|uniref:Myt1 kinase n=1 Tax=Intoshia linei TaxID=1819745 RepID=A0A177B597_9BILA|nr:Myt1 kinase [Intoshia linei]